MSGESASESFHEWKINEVKLTEGKNSGVEF